MRWKAYEPGQRRVLKRFAWHPVRCCYWWVWLEWYYTIDRATERGWRREDTLTKDCYETM